MARLHLLRHGETDWNAEGRWQGHSDRALTGAGVAQAAAIAPAVAALRPVAIHSPDLARARETAAPTATLCELPVVVDVALREIDTGSWTGRRRTEILAAEPGAVGRHEAGEVAWEGGETFAELQDRVVDALERIGGEYGSQEVIAVFVHGGVIRAAVAHAAGGDWRDARRGVAPLTHGSLTIVDVPGWRLECFNVPLVPAAPAQDTA
jgi:glucosyl-3-phosphoglycerate phosphatase